MSKNNIPKIINIPQEELSDFNQMIRDYRAKHIRSSSQIVNQVFIENSEFITCIKTKNNISQLIYDIRERSWELFQADEVDFNAFVMRDLHKVIKTPKSILDSLISKQILNQKDEDLLIKVQELCGEYAGRVFPYLYMLSLSNTQSRRSRAGKTFESIIYKVYEILDYSYDSQSKVGRKIFDQLGLGKKVDSVLPGIEEFKKRRNKTIIGTMKTTLRERWQEVAEEIERTKIPEIHLLTADESISVSKANEMNNHNIVVVAYEWVAESEKLVSMKNIISFEEYLFEEIPNYIKYWK